MRSIAQKYREEGKYEGIELGIEKVAQNMLFKLHLDIDTVEKATGLNQEDLKNYKEITIFFPGYIH